jgi:hypothetical protein
MSMERIAKMTENVAVEAISESVDNTRMASADTPDDALSMVDQALDSMIAAATIMDENLPKVESGSVPQQAAKDSIRDLLDNAIKPYLADMVMAMRTLE